MPFLIFIEAVSYIARVLSLSIRLFANMMSGHALLKILIGFSWALITSGSLLVLIAAFPWAIVTAVMFLELLIAFLQAYVFTILVTLYIGDVLTFHD
jgi:ATP synthase subunit 6